MTQRHETTRLDFRILLLAASLTVSSFSFAQLNERRVFYKSLRYQAMGGAGVAVANDETALLINPAGLGKLRDDYGTMVDPEIEINTKGINAYNKKAYTDPFSLKQVIPTAVKNLNDIYTARGQIMPSFVAKNFGIAILQKYDVQANATTATTVDTFYRDDLALLMGYNLRFFEGRIKVGVTGKMVSRIEIDQTGMDPTQSLNLKNLGTAGIAKAGTGFGFDSGILLAAPWKWLPTIGAVYHDIGGMTYNQTTLKRLSTSTSDPTPTKGDIDVGLSLFPIQSNNVRSTITLEYRSLLVGDDDAAKLIHAGYELNYSDLFFFRVGYNERYWTSGIELASERFQLQLSSYGEEVGTSTKPKEDRRWAFKLSFRF